MARKEYDDDDGRVVTNMNVPGMPWADPMDNKVPSKRTDETKRADFQLTRDESSAIMWGAFKAAMLIAGVFSAVIILVVLGFMFYQEIIEWIKSLF